MNRRLNHHRNDFSLIEILMAIVIAFILIAILIPSLLRAREYAWQSLCMSNMRHIALGFRQYVEDNDGAWPVCTYFLDDFQLIHPYIKTEGLYRCPKRQYMYGAWNVWDEAGCLRNGDYYTSGTIEDIEYNFNFNNGNGNNPYHFDPSNPSTGTAEVLAAKNIDARILYEKYWNCHFSGREFNIFYVTDMHYGKETSGFVHYWTLDGRGYIDTSLDPFPSYMTADIPPGEGYTEPETPTLGDCTFCGGDGLKDNGTTCSKCGGDGWL